MKYSIIYLLCIYSAVSQQPLRFRPVPIANNVRLFSGGFHIPSVAILGKNWFIPTLNGLWKTTNSGKQWVVSGFEGRQCSGVFVTNSHTLIAPVLRIGLDNIPQIYRSTDTGKTWNISPSIYDKSNGGNKLITFVQRGDTIIGIGKDANNSGKAVLCFSTDDGKRWDSLPKNNYRPEYGKHELNKRGDMLTGYYIIDDFTLNKKMVAVFKPKDSVMWKQYPLEQVVNFERPNWFLAPWGTPFATTIEGLYELHKEQWQQVKGIPARNIVCLAFGESGRTYAVWQEGIINTENDTTGGLIISVDSGRTWRQTSGHEGRHIRVLSVSGDSLIGVTGKGYIIFSTNNGESWRRADTGISAYGVTNVSCRGDSVLFAGWDYAGAWLSADNGNNWKSLGFENYYLCSNIIADKSGNMYLSASYQFPGVGVEGVTDSLLCGTNGEVTWKGTRQSRALFKLDIHPKTADVFIAQGGAGLRSSDKGETWIPFYSETGYIQNFCFPGDSSIVFSGDNHALPSGVRISRDYGKTWRVSPATNMSITTQGYSIFFHKGRIFTLNADWDPQKGGMYYSDDIGYTWTKYKHPDILQSSYMNVRAADSNGRLYATSGTLWTSDDNGITWQEVDSAGQLPRGLDINDITISRSGYIFLATSGGIYRSTERFPPVGVQEEPPPTTQELHIIPNPANGTLHWNIPDGTATIINVMGQKMMELPASAHTADISGLAAGVYVLTVRTAIGIVSRTFVKE